MYPIQSSNFDPLRDDQLRRYLEEQDEVPDIFEQADEKYEYERDQQIIETDENGGS
jgi:hypothetical protein